MPARAQRLFTLCGGREAYYGLLEALIDAPVTMTEEAVQAYAARWEGDVYKRQTYEGKYRVHKRCAFEVC